MFHTSKILALGAALLSITLAESSHAATLLGDVIHAEYDFPATGTVYSQSVVSLDPFIVGSGVETAITIEGVTTLSIDFSASSLLITLNTVLTDPTWSSVAQNGPSFTVLSGNPFPGIQSVVASNAGPVSAFLQSGVLFVNWAGMAYHDSDTVRVDFLSSDSGPGDIPLPASGLLLLSGIAGIYGWRRRLLSRRD